MLFKVIKSVKNILLLFLFVCTTAIAQNRELPAKYFDEDYIFASIVIADPGNVMYSCLGHACIRMQCPSQGLDYCYTYESENVNDRIGAFLKGNLKMGMAVVPVETYVSCYQGDGRGVYEYRLNLSLEQRRDLWRLLDQKRAQGMKLPYDYFSRGCSISCLNLIGEVVGKDNITYGPWPGNFNGTNREMCFNASNGFSWYQYFLMTLVGNTEEFDGVANNETKLLVPIELVRTLQNAKLDGKPLLSQEVNVLAKQTKKCKDTWCTPNLVAAIILLFALFNLFIKTPYGDWVVLSIQTLIGIVITYLVCGSSLPCSSWSWLIIPFNPLPLICWKWRKYWAAPYALVIVLWLIGILIWPHMLVHTANLMLASAFALVLFKNSNLKNYIA